MDERQVPRSSRRRRSQNISCRAHSRWWHAALLRLEQEKERRSTLPRFSPGRADPDLAPLAKYSGFALGDSVLAPALACAHSLGSPFLFSPPVLSPVLCRQQPCRRDQLFSRHETHMHWRRTPHPSARFLLFPRKELPACPLLLIHQFAVFSGPSPPAAWSRRKACRSWKKALTDSAAPPAKPQSLWWMQEGKERRATHSLRF